MINISRKKPFERHHDMYFDSDDWTVVDISKVDSVFGTAIVGKDEVRIDIDGFNEPSSEIGEKDDNINTSIWLPTDKAVELRNMLDREIKKLNKEEVDIESKD